MNIRKVSIAHSLLDIAKTAIPFVCLVVVGLLISATDVAERFDLLILDSKFALLRTSEASRASDGVVIVGIDERASDAFQEPIALWHTHLRDVFVALSLAKPRVVGLDIALPQKSYDAIIPNGDMRLAEGLVALRAAAPIFLGITVGRDGKIRPPMPVFIGIAGLDSIGYVLVKTDIDGKVRRFTEKLGEHAEAVPTFVGQILRKLNLKPIDAIINYSIGAPFQYVPLQRVVELGKRNDVKELARLFAGKIILIGSVLPYEDRVPQPVNLAAWEPDGTPPGVIVHAQALRTFLAGAEVKSASATLQAFLVLLAAAIWFFRKKSALSLLAVGGYIAILYFGALFLLGKNIEVAIATAAITAFLAYVAGQLAELAHNIRERQKIHQVFSGYVSPPILNSILSGELENELSKRSRPLCFMFADIRGFTAYSKVTSPEKVIQLLNRYLSVMTDAIHQFDGTVDKFRGDGIMAFFGAPKPLVNASRNGLLAGMAMLDALKTLNVELVAEGEAPIEIGIGLAFGEAVIGNIGSPERHDYTAIGDAVNLAAHIQEHCKKVPFQMLCTNDVFDRAALFSDKISAFAPLVNQELAKHGRLKLYGFNVKHHHSQTSDSM